jgi:uncharacterized lipoprotein
MAIRNISVAAALVITLSACHFDRTYQTPQQRLEQQVQDSYAESARQRKLLNSVMIQTLRARGYTIPAGVE